VGVRKITTFFEGFGGEGRQGKGGHPHQIRKEENKKNNNSRLKCGTLSWADHEKTRNSTKEKSHPKKWD